MKKEGLTTDNSFGVASVTLGVTGIALAFFSNPLVGLVLGIVGLVFSKKQKMLGENVWSRRGKILGIISIILGIVLFIISIIIAFYFAQNPLAIPQLRGLS